MAATSKAEYLKRYLSENAEEKKKKKRKKTHQPVARVTKSRIVDDDVDFKSLLPENLSNTLEEDVGDNDPTVAEVIDERPEYVKQLERYRSSGAWKKLEGKEQARDSPSSLGRKRHDSDSDVSPSRRQRHDSESDPSPIRRQRHDSDSDQSLPRRLRHDSDSDQSPPRMQRQGSDSDQSLPRRRRQGSDSDQSPPRRRRQGSDSDQSPPRRRRQGSDSDQSPPRRRRHASDSDQSPPRKRKIKAGSGTSPKRRKNDISDTKAAKSEKDKLTLGGKRAGLSSAKAMQREAEELKRKEEEQFKNISDERLGRGSETVFRDKSGRRRNLAEEREKDAEEDRKNAAKQEKYQQWGKGLKQLEAQSKAVDDTLHEVSKPLARYKDDNDLDQMLRDMPREEDPMLAFLSKKKSKNQKSVKEKPRYKGPAPAPNRFGILPGYRWDGVDRSNGFERQIYSKMAEKKATAEQAHKWSVEDM